MHSIAPKNNFKKNEDLIKTFLCVTGLQVSPHEASFYQNAEPTKGTRLAARFD